MKSLLSLSLPLRPHPHPVGRLVARIGLLVRAQAALAALAFGGAAFAQTDLANTPFYRTGVIPEPNLLFLMDTSTFMPKTWHPSQVGFDNGGYGLCKVYLVRDPDPSHPTHPTTALYGRHRGSPPNYQGTGIPFSQTTVCRDGDPPHNAPEINQIFYNPKIRYVPPPRRADGTVFPLITNPAAVPVDPFTGFGGTIDVTTQSQEIVYCNSPTANPYSANCRRNGQTGDPTGFSYPDNTKGPMVAGSTPVYQRGGNPYNGSAPITAANSECFQNGAPGAGACFWIQQATGQPMATNTALHNPVPGSYPWGVKRQGPPFYYNLIYTEYCDKPGNNCVAAGSAQANVAPYTYPAKVRYCRSADYAYAPGVVSGDAYPGAPKCSFIYEPFTYHEARLPRFTRVDIVPAMAPTDGGPDRTDCGNPNACTYAEEIRNYANYVAYYNTKEKIVKSSVARSFISLNTSMNIGFVTTTPPSSGRWFEPDISNKYYQPIRPFNDAQKDAFFNKLFGQMSAWGAEFEPAIKEGLSRAGRHFAGKNDGLNFGMNDDPVQYSCQRNYTMLVTDGYQSYYEHGKTGQDINGGSIGNLDNNPADPYSTRLRGNYDGGLPGASGTLADIALYYYKTDLRSAAFGNATNRQSGVNVAQNNVPQTLNDPAQHQHMNLFVVGMTPGKMLYDPLYDTRSSGDFWDIKNAGTSCRWAPGVTCNWPVPVPNGSYDVLWQSAVAGGGKFYAAVSPKDMMTSLKSALTSISLATGSASASATSNAVLTATDRDVFSTTYKTGAWTGEIQAQRIDVATGNVEPGIVWSAQALLDAKTSAAADTRTIYLGAPSGLKPFLWADLDSTEKGYLSGKCSLLTQCGLLNGAEQSIVNNGSQLLGYLRGWRGDEATLFRTREHVLGDMVNSQPVFTGPPRFTFTDGSPSYADYKSASASRAKMLFVGANDGMLHAFDPATGEERWAYVPRMLLPKLPKLADINYPTSHQYYVDGSPEVMDAVIGGSWRTILVGGLNAGGRGYYALDITDPLSPRGLWEICPETLCSVVDTDMGFSYGRPVITKRKIGSGPERWVVLLTSGYNNNAAGCANCWKGILYVLDAASGAVLEKIDTGAGSATHPAGLAQISGYAENFADSNLVKYVYGGDLLGNVWRFDLTQSPALATKLARLEIGGKGQPVTTRPELGDVQGTPIVIVGTGKLLGNADYTDQSSLGIAYEQSLYAIKDHAGNATAPFRTLNVQRQSITPSGANRTVTSNPMDWNDKVGWYIDLNAGGANSGERIALVPPLLEDGTLLVITDVPSPTACTVGGESWTYLIDYQSGGEVRSTSSATLPFGTRSNVLIVGVTAVTLPSGAKKGVGTDMLGGHPTIPMPPNSVMTSRRTAWRDLPQ